MFADGITPRQAKARPDLSTWWTKETTADALNVSSKTVERLAADGEIQSMMYKRPEGGAQHRVYHPGDVERVRKRLHPDAAPFVMPAEKTALAALPARAAPAGLAQAWDRALAVQIAKAGQLFLEAEHHPAKIPATQVLFLTLDQAHRLSGLPVSLIKDLIRLEQLPAMRTGRGWRVRRADLEALTTPDLEVTASTGRRRRLQSPTADIDETGDAETAAEMLDRRRSELAAVRKAQAEAWQTPATAPADAQN